MYRCITCSSKTMEIIIGTELYSWSYELKNSLVYRTCISYKYYPQ